MLVTLVSVQPKPTPSCHRGFACVEAARSAYCPHLAPHSVSKLYYMAETEELFSVYQSIFGDLVMSIDGVKRGIVTWPTWSLSTCIDTWDYWQTVARAIACHRTQVPAYHLLEHLSAEQRKWPQTRT